MLGCGALASIILLFSEHLFFKYALPKIRQEPKTSLWKSPNLMLISQVRLFLPPLPQSRVVLHDSSPNLLISLCRCRRRQKLYRFVNTVEMVSPHHSAKEIMTNLKEGQITSLFQKSLKRVSELLVSPFRRPDRLSIAVYFKAIVLLLPPPACESPVPPFRRLALLLRVLLLLSAS